LTMDSEGKLRLSLDYIFGSSTGSSLPRGKIQISRSRRTGRIKQFSYEGEILGSFRSDGSIALSLNGANFLYSRGALSGNSLKISADAADAVSTGLSLFSKHCLSCGENIRPGSEAILVGPSGKTVAVGKAVLSSRAIKQFKSGVAVKVRHGEDR
ncbi:MAG: PUA domain-containing protein, partial [Nitrososphaerales archaeon]